MNYLKFFIFIFNIFLCISLNSLENINQSVTFNKLTLIDSVRVYHKLINKAEICICNKDNKVAIKQYKEAFKYLKSPFPEDIYNYILLNVYSKKYEEALVFCRKLVKLGAELAFFDQIPLNQLKSNPKEWNCFLDDYNYLRNDYKRIINQDLKEELIKLSRSDQVNFCGRKENQFFDIVTIDSTFQRTLELLDKFNYPGHDQIGMFFENDSTITAPPHDVLFRHIFQERYGDLDKIASVLKNNVQRGMLSPVKYMEWVEFKFQPNRFYGTEILNIINGKLYLNKYDFELFNKNMFNINREDIFVCSFEDNYKKLLFSIKNKNRKFDFKEIGIYISNNDISPQLYQDEALLEIDNFLSSTKSLKCRHRIKAQKIVQIRKYHYYVNKAEANICDNNYTKAFINYTKAFRFSKSPFPNDIKNMLNLCIELEKFDDAIKYSEDLIKIGVSLKFFDQVSFNNFKKDSIKFSNIIANYPKLHNEFQNKIDSNLRKEIVTLNEEYQAIIYGGKEIRLAENLSFDTIFFRLVNIIKIFGYPSHNLIGVIMRNDTIISNSPYYILANYFESHDSLEELTCQLLSEVYIGKLLPKYFANLQEILFQKKNENKLGPSFLMKLNNHTYYLLNENNLEVSKNIDRINKARKNCYCFQFEDELKKLFYILKNNSTKFNFPISLPRKINNILPYLITDTYKKINIDDY